MTQGAIVQMDERMPATRQDMQAMMDALRTMATLLRTTNERMQALEKEVRRLEKVTPGQASTLNALIRARAAEVCRMHRAAGCESAAAAAIRKDVKRMCGISSMRELPRRDYGTAETQVRMWDDYQQMKKIRTRASDDTANGD